MARHWTWVSTNPAAENSVGQYSNYLLDCNRNVGSRRHFLSASLPLAARSNTSQAICSRVRWV